MCVVQRLHVSVICRWFCYSVPTKLLLKFYCLVCVQTSNFLTIFLGKQQNTVCIWLPGFSFCKGCDFLCIFLNNNILITLKLQSEFLVQNTRHYVFSQSLNVNSCKGSFRNSSGLLIRTTDLYCKNIICLNLTHALPGQRPLSFVTFWTNTKSPFGIFLCFFIFIYTKLLG